jgi:hypothetical protein
MLRIDDPVEAFAVHGACGMWGVLAVPLFDINMFDSSAGPELFGSGISFDATMKAQLVGIATIVSWSGILSFIMFSAIKNLGLLRVDEDHEATGIDIAEFSPRNAYSNATIVPQFAQGATELVIGSNDRSPKANGDRFGESGANGKTSEHRFAQETEGQPEQTQLEPMSPVLSDSEPV